MQTGLRIQEGSFFQKIFSLSVIAKLKIRKPDHNRYLKSGTLLGMHLESKKLIMKKLLAVLALGIFSLGFSQNYYDDYRGSISSINWRDVASYLGLNGRQIAAIDVLNNRYPSYDSWNRAYGRTPDRWSRDRYYEMERIMTPAQYKRFYDRYYRGQNPVVIYGKNYDKKYYKQREKYYKKQWKEYNKHRNDDRGWRRDDD